MEVGDIIQINGRLGFEMNPIRQVKEIKGDLVLLATHPPKPDGLLSHINESWHGIDLLKYNKIHD